MLPHAVATVATTAVAWSESKLWGTHPGYTGGALSSGALTSFLCLSSIVPLLYLLKIHPRLLSPFQRVINKSITQNPPTKVLGFCDFSFVFLSCPQSLLSCGEHMMNLSLVGSLCTDWPSVHLRSFLLPSEMSLGWVIAWCCGF